MEETRNRRNERRGSETSPRNRRRLPITNVDTTKIVETTINVLSNANELLDYREGYVYDEDGIAIRCRIYRLRCLDDTEVRIAIFTVNNNSYYSAIEIDDEWVEMTILDSTRNGDTIRFNTRTHQHFYADEDSLMGCGDTPLSKMMLGMLTDRPHIGECCVYAALEDVKKQGLI